MISNVVLHNIYIYALKKKEKNLTKNATTTTTKTTKKKNIIYYIRIYTNASTLSYYMCVLNCN